MAIPTAAVWEIRPTVGNDNNGGFFVAGASGTDYSQQTSPQYALTGLASAGSGNTILSAAAATDMVGNGANAVSGTNINTGYYEVVSVVAGVSITFSTNAAGQSIASGVAASAVINIGGALAHWLTALGGSNDHNVIWVKSTGSDVLTSNGVGSSGQTDIWLIGYTTTRGDTGQATITTSTNGVILFQFSGGSGTRWLLKNLNLTNTAGTRANGIKANLAGSTQTGLTVSNCILDGFDVGINGSNSGFNAGIAGLVVIQTEIKNCTSHGVDMSQNPTYFLDCFIHDNGGNGLFISQANNTAGDNTFERCVFYNNTLSGLRSNSADGNERNNLRTINCVFSTNVLDGIRLDPGSATPTPTVVNCIFWANGGWGINSTTQLTTPAISYNNAYGSNSSGTVTGWVTQAGTVTLSGDPFTNQSTGDFSLNNTGGAGAACRGAGFPTAMP